MPKRFAVSETSDGTVVKIFPGRNPILASTYGVAAFLVVVFALGSGSQPWIRILAGVAVLLGLAAWLFLGEEIVQIGDDTVTVMGTILGFTHTTRIEQGSARSLRVAETGRGLAFSSSPEKVIFGAALPPTDTTALLDNLRDKIMKDDQ